MHTSAEVVVVDAVVVVVVVPPLVVVPLLLLLLVDVVLVAEEFGVDEGEEPPVPLGWDITKMAPDARYSTTATMTIVIPIGETARLGLSFNSETPS